MIVYCFQQHPIWRCQIWQWTAVTTKKNPSMWNGLHQKRRHRDPRRSTGQQSALASAATEIQTNTPPSPISLRARSTRSTWRQRNWGIRLTASLTMWSSHLPASGSIPVRTGWRLSHEVFYGAWLEYGLLCKHIWVLRIGEWTYLNFSVNGNVF